METRVRPFLMFEGNAEEAINRYVSLIPNSRIEGVVRYGPGEMGAEGSVKFADFAIASQAVRAIDSPVKHAFTFTPSFSFFVDCESEALLVQLAEALGEGGQVMMPIGEYGFSRKFTWLSDRYGVSWQLNLP